MLRAINYPISECGKYSEYKPISADIAIGKIGKNYYIVLKDGSEPTSVEAIDFFYTDTHIVFYDNETHYIYNIATKSIVDVGKFLCLGHLQYFDRIRIFASKRAHEVKNITDTTITTLSTTDACLRFCVHTGYNIWIESSLDVSLFNGHQYMSPYHEELYAIEYRINDPEYLYLTIPASNGEMYVYRVKKDGTVNDNAPVFCDNAPVFQYNRRHGITVVTTVDK